MSRVRSGNNIRVFTLHPQRRVQNIVVQGIIDQEDIDLGEKYKTEVYRYF